MKKLLLILSILAFNANMQATEITIKNADLSEAKIHFAKSDGGFMQVIIKPNKSTYIDADLSKPIGWMFKWGTSQAKGHANTFPRNTAIILINEGRYAWFAEIGNKTY